MKTVLAIKDLIVVFIIWVCIQIIKSSFGLLSKKWQEEMGENISKILAPSVGETSETESVNLRKIVFSKDVEKFMAKLPSEATGLTVEDEYIPFSDIVKVSGNTIWLEPNK